MKSNGVKLVRKNFVDYGPKGQVLGLYCKLCGDAIAGVQARRVSPVPGAAMAMKFLRYSNYAEIKIAFNDGSHHVTHGCKKCLGTNMAPDVLQALYEADVLDALTNSKAGAVATRVVQLDHTAKGIV